MLTVLDAAKRIGRDPETVRRWIRVGRLAASKVGTQHFIDEADLAEALGRGAKLKEAPAAYGGGTEMAQGSRAGAAAEPPPLEFVTVSIDAEYGVRLSWLANRAHLSRNAIARSLLMTALDHAEPDPASVESILDSIPDAFERAEQGFHEGLAGQGIPLDDL